MALLKNETLKTRLMFLLVNEISMIATKIILGNNAINPGLHAARGEELVV